MALRRAKPRRRASITSLIDVIFLLLLYFMLATSFSKFSEFEITTNSNTQNNEVIPDILRLLIEPDRISLNDELLAQQEIIRRLRTRPSSSLSVLAVAVTEPVTTQRLTDVLLVLGSVPHLQIHVLEPS